MILSSNITGSLHHVLLCAALAVAVLCSAPATALAQTAPVITSLSPVRQVIYPGADVTLSVSATGATGYQWTRNGQPIADATTASFAVISAVMRDSGAYQAVVTNDSGSTTSALMFVLVAPAVTEVAAWGSNSYAQGAVPEGLADAVAVAAGVIHSLALRADGTVVAWGDDSSGKATVPVGLANVVAIAAGYGHSLALQADGTVVAWGGNNYGQTTVPAGLANVVAVAAGNEHSLALKADGTVVAWGRSSYGQTAVPAGLANVVAVAAGRYHSLALRADGTVAAWGSTHSEGSSYWFPISVPAGLTDVVAVAAGAGVNHSLALKADGTVAWSSTLAGLTDVTAVSAGADYFLALKTDGTVVARGDNTYGRTNVPVGLKDVVAISAGNYHSLALRDRAGLMVFISTTPVSRTVTEGTNVTFSLAAGTVDSPTAYQWRKDGVNISGATGPTLTLASVTTVDNGNYDVVSNNPGSVTTAAATLTVNPLPAIVSQSPQRQVVNPGNPLELGVTATGTGAVSYQWFRNGQAIRGATDATYQRTSSVAADSGAYEVLISDNVGTRRSSLMFVLIAPALTKIRTWGDNSSGQTAIPAGLANVVAVAAGGLHSLALTADGTVAAWGSNVFGQTTVPTGLSDVVAVAAGYGHSMALRADGTVMAWGYNYYGQISVPAGLTNVVAVAAGEKHSLALIANGSVIVWGWNQYGQTSTPAELMNVVAIAGGNEHSLALTADGTVAAWGGSSFDQIKIPAGLVNVVAVAAAQSLSLALKADGTVVGWGDEVFEQAKVPVGLANVVALAAGKSHSLALKANGTVVGWGSSFYGQSTIPTGLANVVAISAGGTHSLALRDATGEPLAPTIISQPSSHAVVLGQDVIIAVTATGIPTPSYQWKVNGVEVTGATNAELVINSAQPSDAGNYTVVVTNALGSVTSNAVLLSFTDNPGRLMNLSIRSGTGAGEQSLIVGFVAAGGTPGAKAVVLVRAAGPALTDYGVPGVLADPVMTLNYGMNVIDSNDDWAGAAALVERAAQVGAFPFPDSFSKDAALALDLDPEPYTAVVTGEGGGTGVALAEVYDANIVYSVSNPELINMSARAQVDTGANIMIAGFVIGGDTARTVLIRAVGPRLGNFGVTGALADPELRVFNSAGVQIAGNDDWSSELTAVFEPIGAFPLMPGSKDAALVVTLQPGLYTVHVSGVGGTTGVALAEVYAVP